MDEKSEAARKVRAALWSVYHESWITSAHPLVRDGVVQTVAALLDALGRPDVREDWLAVHQLTQDGDRLGEHVPYVVQ